MTVRSHALGCVAVAACLTTSLARANFTFETATASGTGFFKSGRSGGPTSTGALTFPAPASGFQFIRGDPDTTSTVHAAGYGSVVHTANTTTAAAGFKAGSGVRQKDNSTPTFASWTVATFQIGQMLFPLSDPNLATGIFFSFKPGGTNASNTFSRVKYDLTFNRVRTGMPLVSVGNAGPAERDYSASTFGGDGDLPITISRPFTNGGLAAGDKLRISGFVALYTGIPNGQDPLQRAGAGDSELSVVGMEVGGGQDTFVFNNFAPATNWGIPQNWLNNEIAVIPDGSTQRARFFEGDVPIRTVTLDSPRTLGTLDASGSATLNIVPLGGPGGPALTFGSGTSAAVIRVGAEGGNQALNIQTRVFANTLEFNSETAAGITVGPATLTLSSTAELIKTGPGLLTLNAPVAAPSAYMFSHSTGTSVINSTLPITTQVVVSGVTGSSVRFSGDQSVNSVQLSEAGRVIVEGAGRRVLKTNFLFTDAPNTAAVDITDGGFILDYSSVAQGTASFNQIATEIERGYAGGAWTGGGITSSVAATSGGLAIGFARATDLSGVAGGTFLGVPTDTTAIVARLTLRGDTDLNGTVNLSDFSTLASNFNQTGRSWRTGDFNYDEMVSIGDFSFLAASFNVVLTASAPSLVPEPSAVSLLVMIAIGARIRRGGRRRNEWALALS